MAKKKIVVPDGYVLIFRATKTVNGKLMRAVDYGLRAWPILIKKAA